MTDIEWGAEIAVNGVRPGFDKSHVACFWKNVSVLGHEDCWEWRGSAIKDRGRIRGIFHFGGKRMTSHRFSAIIAHGPCPDGMECLHSCDNPICCNPNHLRWGAHFDNMQDVKERMRHGNTKKTHCRAGHPLSGDNLRIRKSGRRACRQCDKEKSARDRQKLWDKGLTSKGVVPTYNRINGGV